MGLDVSREVLTIVLEGHGEHRDGPRRFICICYGAKAVDVLHEGAFPRADGVDVPIHHRERTMRVVPRRDGSPVLDAAYRASLGLDALDGP